MSTEDLIRRVIACVDAEGAGQMACETSVDGLTVMRQRTPTELEDSLYEPVFCLVLQGAKQVLAGERSFTFNAMDSAIISHNVPVLTRVVQACHAKPYVALALTLDLTLVHELAAEIDAASDEPQSMIAVGEADDALLGAMDRLFGLVDKPQAAPTLSPLIRREIHYWLLAARHGAMLRALARPDSHAARVARATALIQRGYAETLRVPELARAAGMSASAFHEHFKAITGLTPLQYQKQLRLTKARQLLIGDGETVSGAAFAVGYESPTQFSREYSRRFGASPRADVAAHAHAGGLEPMAVQP